MQEEVVNQKLEATEIQQKNVHIPPEIISEILVRVPAQFLIKFKILCKFWLDLISDPVFVNAHLSHHRHRCDSQQAIIMEQQGKNRCFFSVNLEEDTNTRRSNKFQLHLQNYVKDKKISIHDSCNGLLLLESLHDSNQFYLCNPLTGQCTKFPCTPNGLNFQHWALGYDASAQKYKVFGISWEHWFTFTLSDSTNDETAKISWRQLDTPHNRPLPLYSHIFANNELHWLVAIRPDNKSINYEKYIYSLDVRKELFTMTHIKTDTYGFMKLLELNGYLCVSDQISDYEIDIWALVDRVNCKWNKIHSIHFQLQLCQPAYVYNYPSRNFGQTRILIKYGNLVFVYDLKSEKLKLIEFEKKIQITHQLRHINSLVRWR